MSAHALKRGAAPPKSKRSVRKPPVATVALPLSRTSLRRNLVIGFGSLAVIVALVIATLAGVPRRIWEGTVTASARSGFEIRHVEVSGTHEMARLAVYDAVLSGPTNAMLATDLDAIRARLLALPWVADASVGRRLPDTLVVSISERRPVALWQYKQRLTAIDITGKPLSATHLERFANLPLIVGAGANTRVHEALALTASAPALTGKVDAAILVGGRRWDVKFKSGETLALPDTPAAASEAFRRFASLEANLDENRKLLGGHFERFDMRLPGQMIVGGPAVRMALDAAAKAAKAAKAQKPATMAI